MLVYSDAHLHSNPIRGLGAREITRKFKEVNGWFLCLVSLTPIHYNLPLNISGFEKMVNLVIKECKYARETGVRSICLAGVHPGVIDKLIEKYNLEKAYKISIKAIDLITSKIESGELHGIGEIGRQHYTINPENIIISDLIMDYALEKAKDLNCIVHLHLEHAGKFTVENIIRKVKCLNMKKDKIILHHVSIGVAKYAVKHGFKVTIVGKLNVLKEAKNLIPNILVESDFLDDPNRKCVSMCPWDIPKNIEKLLEQGLVTKNDIEKIFIDNICNTYQVKY